MMVLLVHNEIGHHGRSLDCLAWRKEVSMVWSKPGRSYCSIERSRHGQMLEMMSTVLVQRSLWSICVSFFEETVEITLEIQHSTSAIFPFAAMCSSHFACALARWC